MCGSEFNYTCGTTNYNVNYIGESQAMILNGLNGHSRLRKHFFQGRPKVVKFDFSNSKLRKEPFLLKISKSKSGQGLPSDAHGYDTSIVRQCHYFRQFKNIATNPQLNLKRKRPFLITINVRWSCGKKTTPSYKHLTLSNFFIDETKIVADETVHNRKEHLQRDWQQDRHGTGIFYSGPDFRTTCILRP